MRLHKIILLLVCVFTYTSTTFCVYADNLRQISNHEGISNNAVLSICQDQNGYIWVGTCDGLNMWNGERMRLFPTDWGTTAELSGNLIEQITPTADGYFWICTNYGLDLFNPMLYTIENHTELEGMMRFAAAPRTKAIALTSDNEWHYYDAQERIFKPTEHFIDLPYDVCYSLTWDENDVLTIFSTRGIFRYKISFDNTAANVPHFTQESLTPQIGRLTHSAMDGEVAYLIDEEHTLFVYNILNGTLTKIMNLEGEISHRGNVSHIIRDGQDFLISFYTNGIMRLRSQPENIDERYAIENTEIDCGVFSMLKDSNQDIIWIATDGHGLFAYTKGSTDFHSITYQDLPYQLSKPIRDLYVDKDDNLWVATKGEGVLRILDFYQQHSYTPENTIRYTTENSELLHNSVYAFAESGRNIIWIGDESDGLNYYSYADGKIHSIETHPDIKNVHDIYESSLNTLWITTGNGAYRLSVEGSADAPKITSTERMDFGESMRDRDLFFSLYPDNDDTLWLANRGGGAIEYNIVSGEYKLHTFTGKAVHNDIFSLYRSTNGIMWLASGEGVLRLDTKSPLGGIHGATHGVLEDNNGNLWISTNRGLSKYDQQSQSVVNYGYSYGLHVIEYSDGAYFSDTKHNSLLFGGINGFVVVKDSGYTEHTYHPEILFNNITINKRVYALQERLSKDGTLRIQPTENNFSLNVSALDYINGSNYSYVFRMAGYADSWQATTSTLSFKDIPQGLYTLEVRYTNNMTGEQSGIYSLDIRILAHWWASTTAKIIYVLLAMLFIYLNAYLIIHRYRRHRAEQLKRLEIQRREQQYESKLNLFSNLTHELSIPLTMISAPCQRIISENDIASLPHQHALTIQQNVAKMQNLIYMLHQFRGETVTEKERTIELVSISELTQHIMDMFTAFAEQNNISCHIDVPQNLIWPTDRDGMSTILNNLLSNAFKHTPYSGEVKLSIEHSGDTLTISVANDSKGVDIEDIDAIFDRYRVLDYFEKKSRKGLSITGDLALAICHSITEHLGGRIAVESIPNSTTTFTITLPYINPSEPTQAEQTIVSDMPNYGLPTRAELKQYPFDAKRQTMVIVNDNADIMSLVADLFVDEFNIKIYNSVEGVMELMKQMHPDIIITDLVIKDSENLNFIQQLKQSKLTQHIPVVLLSTPPQIEHRIEAIESGADLCLTLPFNTDYLRASVKQLLRRNSQLKDYYKSSASAFEFTKGKMLHKEDIEFIDKMVSIISENISNNDISTAFIAREMGVSVRNLYRRIENSLQQTPSNIIKEFRLTTAEKLLTTTKLSIDEIIYKAGFANRGTFFRCFSAKYGVTPKVYRTQKLSGIENIKE